MDVTEPLEVSQHSEPIEPTEPLELTVTDDTEWPWDALRAEQEARAGTFTDTMRHEYRWDETAFTGLEEAMRAACAALQGKTTIDRWVGEGFWCWTAVIPELTEHPRFSPPDPHYLRRCLARLRDLGSWFFNGTSPYGPGHVWEPVRSVRP
jgi:hypothetical protein